MMTDALGCSVVPFLEGEASCRGAAILAGLQTGFVSHPEQVPAAKGVSLDPNGERSAKYRDLLVRNEELFHTFYGDLPEPEKTAGLPDYLDDPMSVYF